MNNKKLKYQQQTKDKKRLFFITNICHNPNFEQELVRLINGYDNKKDAHGILFDVYDPYKQVYKLSDHPILLKEAIKKLGNADEHLRLLQRTLHFLMKFNMGKEWIDTLMILCVLGKLSAPSCNFSLDTNVGGKRVLLTLNPDTSLEDLEACFEQIELQPKFKKIKYTKKSEEHFSHDLFVDIAKYREANLKNQRTPSTYETAIHKQKGTSLKQKEKIINEYRKNLGKNKLVHFIHKVSDVEIARIIVKHNKNSNFSRILANIRQDRKRLKMTTS